MAVGLLAWGKNNFKSVKETAQFLEKQGVDIQLDLSFLCNKAIFHYSGKQILLNCNFDKRNWKISHFENYLSLIYQLPNSDAKYTNDYYPWGFGVYIYDDIISFSGPSLHFSHWSTVPDDKNLSSGWQEIIKKIYKFLKTRQIIYFNEWSFDYEEQNEFIEIENWIKENPKLLVKNFNDLSGTQAIFIDEIL